MLVVDSGDLFFRDRFIPEHEEKQQKLKAEIFADTLKDLGMDCILPGEADFAFGYEHYKNLVKRSGVAVVASNFKIEGVYPFSRIFLKEIDGVKYGVIGLVDPKQAWPEVNGKRMEIEDPIAVAQALAREYRAQVDCLIALTHLGHATDLTLVPKVPELDFIFGGHSRELQLASSLQTRPLIYQPGFKGKQQGWVRLRPTAPSPGGNGRRSFAVISGELTPLEIALPEDTAIAKRVTAYKEEAARIGQQTLVNAGRALDNSDVYWGASLCGQCHAPQEKFWKGTLHSHAYQTLVDKQKHMDMECLACHTTGFSSLKARMSQGQKTMVDVTGMESVQCESCHAPGSRHSTPEIRSLARLEATCTTCHTKTMDPGFDFAKKLKMVACPQTTAH